VTTAFLNNLTFAAIRKNFSSAYFQRGQQYQRAGRVLSLEWDEEREILYGEVRGSGRNRYEQDIFFVPKQGGLNIEGECSCPVGYNCKHVAAVVLEWQANEHSEQRSLPATVSALQDWQQAAMERLQASFANPCPEPGQACLLHLLVPKKNYWSQFVELHTVKSRRLKKGGWGKTSHFDLSDLNGYHYYYGPTVAALPQDKQLAQLLCPEEDPVSHPCLEGEVGLLALQILLRSGRCFFESPKNPPLRSGPERRLRLNWQSEQGRTRLHFHLEESTHPWLLIPTEPAWYLEPDTGLCGPILEQPCPSVLLGSLQSLPELSKEELPQIGLFFLDNPSARDLPLPLELDLKRCAEPPVPTLVLRGVNGPRGDLHHVLRVRFAYGPFSLPPLAPGDKDCLLLKRDGQHWQIQRDAEAENTALGELDPWRMMPAGPLGEEGERDLIFDVDSLAESARAWRTLLAGLPRWEERGWRIEIEPSFALQFETADNLLAEVEESDAGWFEVGLQIDYRGHKIDLLPLLQQWLSSGDQTRSLMYPLGDNRWLEIPVSLIAPVVETLVELFQDPQFSANDRLRLPRTQAHSLLEAERRLNRSDHQLRWQGSPAIRRLAQKLQDFNGITPIAPPCGLRADLRDYQQQGLSWLQFLRKFEFNGILADDMGLGKTIQTLSHLLVEKEADRLQQPVLIVAPTSVLSNWRHEAERFTPDLRSLVLHGPQRAEYFARLQEYDLIITSYALLVRDGEFHRQQSYHSLVLDEAQAVKNPRAKASQVARSLNARHRLCLTGTPLENHLGELWALFHFLMPGFLGQQKQFTQLFRTPIERHGNTERQQTLQQRIAPFVLRRSKELVAKELPAKTMMVREAELGSAQAKLYESLRLSMVKKIGRLLEAKGLQKGHIEILDALLKLRQACCDPRLVKLAAARQVTQSAKLDELLELLDKLLEEERKILIFSQFTSMLALIEAELQSRDISYSKLTGRTRNRDQAISAFQEGGAQVFLISLKAGGVGLNLTAADTVIHYDPWWNPAAENQATDRAHRIGQDKPVFVYKLVAKGTIEEKILQLQEKKQRLADGIYRQDAEQNTPGTLTADEILALLAPID